MRVFVTGGTGAIGGYAVPALVAAGHDVHALARSNAGASALRAQGATPVRVSLFDRDDLARSFEGCGAVANLASALPGTTSFIRRSAWAECHRIRREGSATVVAAAVAADVPRVLQESVAMVYVDSGDRWIDEKFPVEHYPIAAGNHAAEASAHRFTGSGGAGVVLRFGMFYGAGAAHSEQLMALARRRIGFRAGGPMPTFPRSISPMPPTPWCPHFRSIPAHTTSSTTSRSPSGTTRRPWPRRSAHVRS